MIGRLIHWIRGFDEPPKGGYSREMEEGAIIMMRRHENI